MNNWINWFEAPYAENDTTLNQFVDDLAHRVSWKLFDNQEQIVLMANETDSGIPMMKEGIIEYISSTINSELSWLRQYVITRILVGYLKGNVAINEEVDWWFQDELNKEDYAEFMNEINHHIWDDYARFLGEDRTAELWEKWGKEPLN